MSLSNSDIVAVHDQISNNVYSATVDQLLVLCRDPSDYNFIVTVDGVTSLVPCNSIQDTYVLAVTKPDGKTYKCFGSDILNTFPKIGTVNIVGISGSVK